MGSGDSSLSATNVQRRRQSVRHRRIRRIGFGYGFGGGFGGGLGAVWGGIGGGANRQRFRVAEGAISGIFGHGGLFGSTRRNHHAQRCDSPRVRRNLHRLQHHRHGQHQGSTFDDLGVVLGSGGPGSPFSLSITGTTTTGHTALIGLGTGNTYNDGGGNTLANLYTQGLNPTPTGSAVVKMTSLVPVKGELPNLSAGRRLVVPFATHSIGRLIRAWFALVRESPPVVVCAAQPPNRLRKNGWNASSSEIAESTPNTSHIHCS